jgi:hypothetical protein
MLKLSVDRDAVLMEVVERRRAAVGLRYHFPRLELCDTKN